MPRVWFDISMVCVKSLLLFTPCATSLDKERQTYNKFKSSYYYLTMVININLVRIIIVILRLVVLVRFFGTIRAGYARAPYIAKIHIK